MISRRTSSVPKEEVAFPRQLNCDSRRSQTCCQCSQVLPGQLSALPDLLPAQADVLRLVVGAHRLVAAAPRCSRVLPTISPALRGVPKPITIALIVLLYQSSEIPVTMKAHRNALQGSNTLLKLTHLSLHSTSSQTLLEASSE